MGLADKIRENHELAATTQQALRNGRRVIRRIAEETPISVPAVMEAQPLPQPVPIPHTAITGSPLDLPAEHFKAGLDRRKANRELLMEWLSASLTEGIDYGRLHITSRERCQFARQGRVSDCHDQSHWTKPSLRKSGAEKVCSALGFTVHFPSLAKYEELALSAAEIKTIVIRCELHDAHGRVVAEGIGARDTRQDSNLNASLKLAEKSAHIDATLRIAAVSDCFTQDMDSVDDLPPEVTPPLPPKPQRSAKSATPASGATAATDEQIGREALEALRQEIRQYGFTEKRVLAWLYKTTGGSVTKLDQLTQAQCASILRRLEIWSEGEKTFANGQAQQEGGSHE